MVGCSHPCVMNNNPIFGVVPKGFLHTLYPEIHSKSGRYEVMHKTFKHSINTIGNPEFAYLEEGDCITCLLDTHKKQVIMSDTPMEVLTNTKALETSLKASTVLIGGLGLAMLPMAINICNPEVDVTIIELSEELASLILSVTSKHLISKVVIADVFKYEIPEGNKFDYIYMDIWNEVSSDNADDMAALYEIYHPYLKEGGRFECWRSTDTFMMYHHRYGCFPDNVVAVVDGKEYSEVHLHKEIEIETFRFI